MLSRRCSTISRWSARPGTTSGRSLSSMISRPGCRRWSRIASVAGTNAALTALAALTAFAPACRSHDIALFDVSGGGIDYFFLAAVDAGGRPTRASSVFGVQGDAIAFGGRPYLALGPGESSAVMVGLTRQALAS